MENKQSTTRGFAILSLTGLICKILALIYVPIQTAIVGDAGNDIIGFGYRIYTFMFSLSNAGLPSSISKMVAEQNALGNYKGSRKIFKAATVILLILGVVFCVALASGAKWIAVHFRQNETYLMLLTLAPAFLFTSINCALRGYFQGNRNMVPTAISNVVEQGLNSVFTVVLIYLLFTFTGHTASAKMSNAAAGSALGTIIGAAGATAFLVFVFLVTREQRVRREHHSLYNGPELSYREILWQLALYILPALLGAVASSAADLIDSTNCIKLMMKGGISHSLAYSINGQYMTQYQRIINLTIFVSNALMTALIPAISKSCSVGNRKALKHSINSSFKALYIFMLPCLTGFTLFARPIISLIFFSTGTRAFGVAAVQAMNAGGDKFMMYWSWSNLLLGMITLQTGILIGISKPLSAPVNLIIGMVVKYFLNNWLIAIPALNMHGAAIGSAIGWLITVLLNNYAIHRGTGIKVHYIRQLLRPLAFSAIMGLTYFPFQLFHWIIGKIVSVPLLNNDISLLLTVALAAYIYALLIIKSRTLTREEIAQLPMGGKLLRLFRGIRLMPD